MSIVFASIFSSPQNSVISELIERGQIGFYLRIFGRYFSLFGRVVSALKFAFICILFHYMLGFVSKNEVIKRMGKFQAFRECLHNVALIGNIVRTDFYGDGERKNLFKPELSQDGG